MNKVLCTPELCIARSELDRVLLELVGSNAERRGSQTLLSGSTVAYGNITPSGPPHRRRWVAGRLQLGDLAERPRHAPLSAVSDDSMLLIVRPVHTLAGVEDAAAAKAWLDRCAAAYRLATELSNPSVLLLQLATGRPEHDGMLAYEFSSRHNTMQRLELKLTLPGADMRSGIPVSTRRETSHTSSKPLVPQGAHRRYSRLAGALGEDNLAKIQASTFAVVGVGRTGSTVAHSIVRLGASLALIDADHVELHNCDGDVSPMHEGLSKVEAMRRFVRESVRPGARIDPRRLSIRDLAAASAIEQSDFLISAVDNPIARRAASIWALALLKPHLDIGVSIRESGAEADLRLIPPGMGCIECLGGAAAAQVDLPPRPPVLGVPGDFRRERLGSLRSFNVAAGHLGLRMIEQLYSGRLRNAVFRRISEGEHGDLATRDLVFGHGAAGCTVCAKFLGVGATRAGRYVEQLA